MATNIYPPGCEFEQRQTITALLSALNGNTRVVSVDYFNRACDFYVDLMKKEKELRENHPGEVCIHPIKVFYYPPQRS